MKHKKRLLALEKSTASKNLVITLVKYSGNVEEREKSIEGAGKGIIVWYFSECKPQMWQDS